VNEFIFENESARVFDGTSATRLSLVAPRMGLLMKRLLMRNSSATLGSSARARLK